MASPIIRLDTSLGELCERGEHSVSSSQTKSPLLFGKTVSPNKMTFSQGDHSSTLDDDNISPTLSPQLLATSSDGLGDELVPSISNISLLSLNQQHSLSEAPQSSSSGNARQRNLRSSTAMGFFQPPPSPNYGSRKPSMNSPGILRRPSNYQCASRKNSTNMDFSEPDSPSLAPISIAGSPSNFMLSQNSPPASLKNQMGAYLMANQIPRYLRNGRRLSQPQSGLSHASLSRPLQPLESQSPLQMTPLLRLNLQKSPELIPVSTTLAPVTPLNLSMPSVLSMRSNSQVVFDDDDDDEADADDTDFQSPISASAHRPRTFGSNETNDDIFGEKIDV